VSHIKTIKWGILGPGGIAQQFTRDLKFAEHAEAVAVGSRSKEKAEAFAKEFGIARSYGSYEELVADSEVDIVYVATPHPYHREHVMLCLRAGKAVLCEKPFTVSAAETEELVSYARDNKLFLMEAMWTRYLPGIIKVREWLKEGRIGEIRMAKGEFGFRIGWDPASRLLNPDLAGGALLDAGIYPVSFASMVFGGPPETIVSSATIGKTGVDEQYSLLFTYSGGRTASLSGAVRLRMDNEFVIYGTEGKITIPNFFMAKTVILQVYDREEERFEDKGRMKGYAFEAEEAGRCLREGRTESDVMPLAETLQLMKTLDTIRGQWGLKYPFE
jgi:dihydrodiol dehydrogenase / D-xylose 1-dehydrogenase (NADP)